MIKDLIRFLSEDIWRLRQRDLPKGKSIGLKALRVVLYAFKGFNEDKCQLSAAALTFWTLFSIVPLFAMAFGIAKGFGLEKLLREELYQQIQGQEEVMARIIEFSERMLETTSGGLIAGIGLGILFFTVIRLLGNIEMSLNEIWGVKEHRNWVRKFSDYLAIMIVCPSLLIVVSSLNVYIATKVENMTEQVEILNMFSQFIQLGLKILPFFVLWNLFSFIYVVIPNTRVNIVAGIVGGVAAGTIYQIFQGLYLNLQFWFSSTNAVYGSFAALPLFLFWLQTSWLIMLLGAEISFAYQNVDTYELEPDCLKASERFRKLVALQIATVVIKAFVSGKAPVSESSIAEKVEMPSRLVKDLLHQLVQSGILIELRSAGTREMSYTAAKDPDSLTVSHVLNAMEMQGLTEVPVPETSEFQRLKSLLHESDVLLRDQSLSLALKDL